MLVCQREEWFNKKTTISQSISKATYNPTYPTRPLQVFISPNVFFQSLDVLQSYGKEIASAINSNVDRLKGFRMGLCFGPGPIELSLKEENFPLTRFEEVNTRFLHCMGVELSRRITIFTREFRQSSSSSFSQMGPIMRKHVALFAERLLDLLQALFVPYRKVIIVLHNMLDGEQIRISDNAPLDIESMKAKGYFLHFFDESPGNIPTLFFTKMSSNSLREKGVSYLLERHVQVMKEITYLNIFLEWLSSASTIAFPACIPNSSERTTKELFLELQWADLIDQENVSPSKENPSLSQKKVTRRRKQKMSISPPPDQQLERLSPPPQCLRNPPPFVFDTQTFEERSPCLQSISSETSLSFLSTEMYVDQYLTPSRELSIPFCLTRLSAHQFFELSSHLDQLFFHRPMQRERHEKRCQELIKGVFHHSFLSACGFEIMCSLIKKRRFDLLPAVFPIWSSDRYLQVESSFDMIGLLSQNREGNVHSLKELYEEVRLFLPLPQDLEIYIQGNSWGLFSYRYFMSLREQFAELEEELPGELRWIDVLNTRFRSCETLGPDDLHPIIECICALQGFSFQFLHRVLSREDGRGLISLQVSSDKLKELKTFLHTAIDHPESLEEPDVQEPRFDEEKRALHDLIGRCERLQGLFQREPGEDHLQKQKTISIRELINHLRLLEQSLDLISLFEASRFSAFHERNLLNVNWCIEAILRFVVMQTRGEHLISHHFEDYLAFFENERDDSLAHEFREYNSGIGIQYETSYKKRVPALERYRERLLPASIEEGRCEETFHPASSRVGNLSLAIENEVKGICRLLLRAVDFLERHFHEDMSATGPHTLES